MEFFRYDRWDSLICVLNDIVSASHYQEAGGENALTLTTKSPLDKGDRIVWCDCGTWREHVANEPCANRGSDGTLLYTTYCEDAICELSRDKVDEKRIRSGLSSEAISRILEQTRWELGDCDVTAIRTKSFYHCSVGEALSAVAETWGGELYSSFEVDEHGIISRRVNHVAAMGDRLSVKRFEYGKDLVSVKRTVAADDVYTAMRGYGKGESLDDDEWGRRITFEELNGGRDYVEDADALALWGRPDGSGGKAHAFGTVIFEDCEDSAELMELTRQELDGCKEPKVSYECGVLDLARMGYDYEGVGLGDSVAVVDSAFEPTLRLTARVMALKRNLLETADVQVTIGNIRGDIARASASQATKIDSLVRKSGAWDVAASMPPAYLDALVGRLNAQFDEGGAYQYGSFEQGSIWSSVPLDEDLKPTKTPASAIQLKGGGFRIASSVKADGTFDWRTFGTGSGFTADEITAGVIRGGNSYWNLETGDLVVVTGEFSGKITATSGTVGGFEIGADYLIRPGMRLTGSGVAFSDGGVEAVSIGASHLVADETKKAAVLAATMGCSWMGFAAEMTEGTAKQRFGWSRDDDQMLLYCGLDGRNHVAKNLWLDASNSGFSGGQTVKTLNFCLPTVINSDGTIGYHYHSCYLEFRYGVLVGYSLPVS